MTVDIKKLKNAEKDILISFIACCDKLNLRYYLLEGTLLGAVRHKGFIPWDDDIDVGMLRKDYEIFLKKGQAELPKHLFLQTYKTDPEFLNVFAKIRDSRTTFIETSLKRRNINHGIFIDIFPLDFYPTDEKTQKDILKKIKLIKLRIRKEYTLPPEIRNGIVKETIKNVTGFLLKLNYPKVQDALAALDRIYSSCTKSDLLTNFCGVYGKKSIVPCDWFGEGVLGSFEDISANLPQKYNLYLKQVYGNYMEYPPLDKRIPHHFAEIIDPDTPFVNYVNTNK